MTEQLVAPPDYGPRPGYAWRNLLFGYGILLAICSAFFTILFQPSPLSVAGLLALVGAIFIRRTFGLVLAGLGSLMWLAFFGIFLWHNVLLPEGFSDFSLALAVGVGAVLGVIAVIPAIASRKSPAASGAARTLAIVGVVVLVAGLGYSAYRSATIEEQAPAAGDIRVVTKNGEFDPETLTATEGTISVNVRNLDRDLHTFTIEELEVNLVLPAGSQRTVKFRAEAGTYRFVCAPHAPDMDGTLVVS